MCLRRLQNTKKVASTPPSRRSPLWTHDRKHIFATEYRALTTEQHVSLRKTAFTRTKLNEIISNSVHGSEKVAVLVAVLKLGTLMKMHKNGTVTM